MDSEQKRKAAREQKAKKQEEKARKAEEKTKKVAERKQSKRGRKAKRVEEVDTITRNLRSCTINDQEEETHCPIFNALYDDSCSIWICCDKCNVWYNLECTNMPEDSVPDSFYCGRC